MPVKSWIAGSAVVLIAGATLYVVYALTASIPRQPIQREVIEHRPIQSADGDYPHFAQEATYQVCFTPGDDCTSMIVQAINASVRRIHLQAYVFTDEKIARSLEDASRRNIEVIVLLDKRARSERNSVAPELMKAGLKSCSTVVLPLLITRRS